MASKTVRLAFSSAPYHPRGQRLAPDTSSTPPCREYLPAGQCFSAFITGETLCQLHLALK